MCRSKYYAPREVSLHNTMDDLWVSFLSKVYNLTPLCETYKGTGIRNYIVFFLLLHENQLHIANLDMQCCNSELLI